MSENAEDAFASHISTPASHDPDETDHFLDSEWIEETEWLLNGGETTDGTWRMTVETPNGQRMNSSQSEDLGSVLGLIAQHTPAILGAVQAALPALGQLVRQAAAAEQSERERGRLTDGTAELAAASFAALEDHLGYGPLRAAAGKIPADTFLDDAEIAPIIPAIIGLVSALAPVAQQVISMATQPRRPAPPPPPPPRAPQPPPPPPRAPSPPPARPVPQTPVPIRAAPAPGGVPSPPPAPPALQSGSLDQLAQVLPLVVQLLSQLGPAPQPSVFGVPMSS